MALSSAVFADNISQLSHQIPALCAPVAPLICPHLMAISWWQATLPSYNCILGAVKPVILSVNRSW
jgi:hypothetical protein